MNTCLLGEHDDKLGAFGVLLSHLLLLHCLGELQSREGRHVRNNSGYSIGMRARAEKIHKAKAQITENTEGPHLRPKREVRDGDILQLDA